MFAYIVRRVLYALPILIGVNLITFLLFFVVNTPDDMARMQLGAKRVTPDAIEKWKVERGYDKPLLWNEKAAGVGKATQTIFYEKSVRLFALDFGAAEDKRDIANEIRSRMGPSLALAIPALILGLLVNITFAMLMAFFRATYLDFWGVVLCVAMMSISALFYIIGGQYIVSKLWHLVPISGYDGGLDASRFVILPVLIGVVSGIGSGGRWYRTLFLEEIGRDYVRTARAKGLYERRVVLKHALRNAMTPVITLGALEFGTLLSGAVLTEQIFTIPGFGKLIVDAVFNRDYAVVQGVVLVTATTYIALNLLADICYVLANPRLRG
jgi:peptide/nickel transport system permease protein